MVTGGAQVDIVVPDLRGAIVLKARAALGDRRDNERHIMDVAFLCSLVSDPLGLSAALGGSAQHSYLEAVCKVDAYLLRSRVVVQSGGLAFPPDMVPGGLVVSKRLAEYDGLNAILDNDGSLETREIYSANGVAKHLDAIHKIIGNAFRAIATDHARKVWDQEQ